MDVWEAKSYLDPTVSKRVFKSFFKEALPSRCIAYSEKLFAYGSSEAVRIFNSSYELKYTIPHARSHVLKFSPKGTFLIVYEIFISTKENPNSPNMFIYEADTGKELISFVLKKHSEWEPYFSKDETVFAIMLSGDVHFYEISDSDHAFTKTPHKLTGKVGCFSLSSGFSTHVALYLQGTKGSPSMARLFKYGPNMDTPIASKSFSQADKVEMFWNKKGNGCLIMASSDVDSTGVSYYGKQALHFLATNGDSYSVPLSRLIFNYF